MVLLEVADVGRRLGVVPATVRALARAGRLRVAARTPRGTRLFRLVDVETLLRERAKGELPQRSKVEGAVPPPEADRMAM